MDQQFPFDSDADAAGGRGKERGAAAVCTVAVLFPLWVPFAHLSTFPCLSVLPSSLPSLSLVPFPSLFLSLSLSHHPFLPFPLLFLLSLFTLLSTAFFPSSLPPSPQLRYCSPPDFVRFNSRKLDSSNSPKDDFPLPQLQQCPMTSKSGAATTNGIHRCCPVLPKAMLQRSKRRHG